MRRAHKPELTPLRTRRALETAQPHLIDPTPSLEPAPVLVPEQEPALAVPALHWPEQRPLW